MLEQLGDLLRLALDHAEDQVIPLQRELAFVDRYMKLQKVRYEDRLDVVLDVDPLALQALVPTFILQPLLENAIRHGIATRSTPGRSKSRPGARATSSTCRYATTARDSPPTGTSSEGPGSASEHTGAAEAPVRRRPELPHRGPRRHRRPGRPALSPATGRASAAAGGRDPPFLSSDDRPAWPAFRSSSTKRAATISANSTLLMCTGQACTGMSGRSSARSAARKPASAASSQNGPPGTFGIDRPCVGTTTSVGPVASSSRAAKIRPAHHLVGEACGPA